MTALMEDLLSHDHRNGLTYDTLGRTGMSAGAGTALVCQVS
jgi:hypothetical protein